MSAEWLTAGDSFYLNLSMVYRWKKSILGVYTIYYISGDTDSLPSASNSRLEQFAGSAAQVARGIVEVSSTEGVNLDNVLRVEDNGTTLTLYWPSGLLGTGYTGTSRANIRAAMGIG